MIMTEFSRQYGSSWFNFSAKCLSIMPNICLLEFDYASDIYVLAFESTASIMVTLGTILNAATELLVLELCHFFLRKSLIPSQVSSKHINLVSGLSFRNANAHCYLNIKDLLEFPPTGIYYTLVYFIPWSCITFITNWSLKSYPVWILIAF